jgi:hypothetical protein
MEVINAYARVIAVMIPNCCSGGIGANARTPKPNMEERAAIRTALPVREIVSVTAFVTSPV